MEQSTTPALSDTTPTLSDLPSVTKDFCENAPEHLKSQCYSCLNTDNYTCMYEHKNFGIQQGQSFTNEEAIKSCCLDLRKSVIQKDQNKEKE